MLQWPGRCSSMWRLKAPCGVWWEEKLGQEGRKQGRGKGARFRNAVCRKEEEGWPGKGGGSQREGKDHHWQANKTSIQQYYTAHDSDPIALQSEQAFRSVHRPSD